MFGFLKRLFGIRRFSKKKAIAYEDARDALASQDTGARRELAEREDLKPEMLYYLAHDTDVGVRALVAANPATPFQANEMLADDEAAEVRGELARKIARLMPDLSHHEQHKLRDKAIEIMEKLARDQETKVRQILAEEIKDSGLVPPHLVKRLAFDPSISVCGPILRYSPLLSDADLIEILATSQVTGVIEAVAGREHLAEDVSDKVVASLDVPAIATLLANKSAQIRASTMDEIIANAEQVAAWHEPMAMRPDLSVRAVRRIAQFVSRELVQSLAMRTGLDEETRKSLTGRMKARLEEKPEPESTKAAVEIVNRARQQGRLDAAFIIQAAESGLEEQTAYALGLLSGLTANSVKQIFHSRNGKAITALVWRARLPMRVSVAIQTHLMQLRAGENLPARNGTEFPISEDEMSMLLEYFGIAA